MIRELRDFFFRPNREEGTTSLLGHRFLLKSSTRDCATGPAIQFRRGSNRRGNVRGGAGTGRGVWIAIVGIKDVRLRRASRIPLLPNSGFLSDSLSASERVVEFGRLSLLASTDRSDLPGSASIRLARGFLTLESECQGANGQASERASKRSYVRTAAAQRGHSSCVAKLRVFSMACRVLACSFACIPSSPFSCSTSCRVCQRVFACGWLDELERATSPIASARTGH